MGRSGGGEVGGAALNIPMLSCKKCRNKSNKTRTVSLNKKLLRKLNKPPTSTSSVSASFLAASLL